MGYQLPEKNRKAGADLRGKLQEIGILRESGHAGTSTVLWWFR